MGWGDACFMAGIGAILGWRLTLLAFYAGIMAGGVGIAVLMIRGKVRWGRGDLWLLVIPVQLRDNGKAPPSQVPGPGIAHGVHIDVHLSPPDRPKIDLPDRRPRGRRNQLLLDGKALAPAMTGYARQGRTAGELQHTEQNRKQTKTPRQTTPARKNRPFHHGSRSPSSKARITG